jgi:hypothetical protein
VDKQKTSIMHNRIIKSKARSSIVQLADCISSLFALELLSPSPEIYLISPWIGDVPLLNNSYGQYRSIAPEMTKRWIGLLDLINMLSERGSKVHILTRTNQVQNDSFLRRLSARVLRKQTTNLHEKGLITHCFYLRGSMNFTYSGVNLNDENVELTTDPNIISQAFIEAQQRWNDID